MLDFCRRPWFWEAWRARRRGPRRPARGRTVPGLESLEARVVPAGPSVLSIARAAPAGPFTSAASVSYTVTFNESVSNVTASAFQLALTGSLRAGGPVAVTGGGAVYTVAVNGLHGDGDLRLDLIDTDTIVDGFNVPLGGPGPDNGSFQGQTYTILQADPSVVSLTGTTPASLSASASTVTFTVTFSGAVTGVAASDFQTVPTGSVAVTGPLSVAGSGAVYTVTVAGITGTGTLGLNLVDNGTIHDLAGNPLAPPQGGLGLTAVAPVTVGKAATALAVADLDGDGIPDLVYTDEADNLVQVLLANGNGTFTALAPINAGPSPHGVAVADVNGDGIPDLVVTNDLPGGFVTVLLGQGDGIFSPLKAVPAGSHPVAVAVADVTGDGKPDLVVADGGNASVSLLAGNGDGTFQLPRSVDAPNPDAVAVADLTGDGQPDVALVEGFTPGRVAVFPVAGGAFLPPSSLGVDSRPTALAVTDLNGDGLPDLVVANGGSGDVSVLLGKGGGAFQPQATFAVGTLPSSVAVADLNGDGLPDLAVGTAKGITVLLGKGGGSFVNAGTFAAGTNLVGVAAADLAGSGKLDLVALGQAGTVGVLRNTAVGDFTGQVYTNIAVQPTALTVSSSGTPADFGQAVTFTAAVTAGGGGTPTGTVQFLADGVSLGGPVPLAGATATLTTAALSVGTHQIVAVYGGDSSFGAASNADAPFSQTVNPVFTISGPPTVQLGAPYVLQLSAAPPGLVVTGWTVSWGDGTVTNVAGNPPTVSHVYTDGPNAFRISATATAAGGLFAARSPFLVTVLTPLVAGWASGAVASGPLTLTIPGPFGLTATLTVPGPNLRPVTFFVATYLANPTATPVAAPAFFYDVRVSDSLTGKALGLALPGISVAVTFRFPPTPGAGLRFFLTPLGIFLPVLGSATTPVPPPDPAHGQIQTVLDLTSLPPVTGLGGTVFTVTLVRERSSNSNESAQNTTTATLGSALVAAASRADPPAGQTVVAFQSSSDLTVSLTPLQDSRAVANRPVSEVDDPKKLGAQAAEVVDETIRLVDQILRQVFGPDTPPRSPAPVKPPAPRAETESGPDDKTAAPDDASWESLLDAPLPTVPGDRPGPAAALPAAPEEAPLAAAWAAFLVLALTRPPSPSDNGSPPPDGWRRRTAAGP